MKKLSLSILLLFQILIVSLFFSLAVVQAAPYSCGDYGASTYQNGTCTAAADNHGGGLSLANTGNNILLVASILAIAAGVTTFVIRRRRYAHQEE